jgi:hypothetical protein
MRRLNYANKKIISGKYTVTISTILSFILIGNPYLPTIYYLKFKYLDDGIIKLSSVSIRMDNGWYPLGCSCTPESPHITLIKINPWIPNGEVLSQVDLIYQPNFVLKNLSDFRVERMRWRDALFFRERRDVAFSLHGRLRIFFSKNSDLDEIIEISEIR